MFKEHSKFYTFYRVVQFIAIGQPSESTQHCRYGQIRRQVTITGHCCQILFAFKNIAKLNEFYQQCFLSLIQNLRVVHKTFTFGDSVTSLIFLKYKPEFDRFVLVEEFSSSVLIIWKSKLHSFSVVILALKSFGFTTCFFVFRAKSEIVKRGRSDFSGFKSVL